MGRYVDVVVCFYVGAERFSAVRNSCHCNGGKTHECSLEWRDLGLEDPVQVERTIFMQRRYLRERCSVGPQDCMGQVEDEQDWPYCGKWSPKGVP
eukprot:3667302-Amphidinium_carterae.1